jgi:hypothetical protein
VLRGTGLDATDDSTVDDPLARSADASVVEESGAIGTDAPSRFFGRPPMELLRHFHDGDPLRMLQRGARRLAETGIMMCERRLFLRGIARAALAGCHYRGEPALDAWVGECVNRSIEDVLEEDRRADRHDEEIDDERHYRLLIDLLDVSAKKLLESVIADRAAPIARSIDRAQSVARSLEDRVGRATRRVTHAFRP